MSTYNVTGDTTTEQPTTTSGSNSAVDENGDASNFVDRTATNSNETDAFCVTPDGMERGKQTSTPCGQPRHLPPHGIEFSTINSGTPESAIQTYPGKENEFTILKIASTLKEASVQLETEWLDREKKQRQVESVWLESTVEVERRQRQDVQKYVVVIQSQQNEITDLHQLREENRIELLKRKHESITLNVNSKKNKENYRTIEGKSGDEEGHTRVWFGLLEFNVSLSQ